MDGKQIGLLNCGWLDKRSPIAYLQSTIVGIARLRREKPVIKFQKGKLIASQRLVNKKFI